MISQHDLLISNEPKLLVLFWKQNRVLDILHCVHCVACLHTELDDTGWHWTKQADPSFGKRTQWWFIERRGSEKRDDRSKISVVLTNFGKEKQTLSSLNISFF